MNPKIYKFLTEIKKVPDIDGAYVEVPYDIKTEFGKGRVKVHATFDGMAYNGSVVSMGRHADGSARYMIGVRKAIRAEIGKQPGDYVQVSICERE
ncbi:hypothetical protein DSECCO2_334570 [anaerobic digester metagenome]|uniref:DUF1905 domain-containing protein n=1 Tax=Oscillibacter ruminantium TaxID=1263547 RepID=UPI002B1F8788|nr:DUF1905 domain-containing protein [Oscillibacter ruminantium]MEA5041290.1 DUF1905 domain-containing protein [Oscillibacter ruminantium]